MYSVFFWFLLTSAVEELSFSWIVFPSVIPRGSGDSWCITCAETCSLLSCSHPSCPPCLALPGPEIIGTVGPQSAQEGGLDFVRHAVFFSKWSEVNPDLCTPEPSLGSLFITSQHCLLLNQLWALVGLNGQDTNESKKILVRRPRMGTDNVSWALTTWMWKLTLLALSSSQQQTSHADKLGWLGRALNKDSSTALCQGLGQAARFWEACLHQGNMHLTLTSHPSPSLPPILLCSLLAIHQSQWVPVCQGRVGVGVQELILRTNQKISGTNLVKVGDFLAPFPPYGRKMKLYRQGVKAEKKLSGFRDSNSNHTPCTEYLHLSSRCPGYWPSFYVSLFLLLLWNVPLKAAGFLMERDICGPITLHLVCWHLWSRHT